LNRCIAKLTGVAIPQHDSGHATTAALMKRASALYQVLSELSEYVQPWTTCTFHTPWHFQLLLPWA